MEGEKKNTREKREQAESGEKKQRHRAKGKLKKTGRQR